MMLRSMSSRVFGVAAPQSTHVDVRADEERAGACAKQALPTLADGVNQMTVPPPLAEAGLPLTSWRGLVADVEGLWCQGEAVEELRTMLFLLHFSGLFGAPLFLLFLFVLWEYTEEDSTERAVILIVWLVLYYGPLVLLRKKMAQMRARLHANGTEIAQKWTNQLHGVATVEYVEGSEAFKVTRPRRWAILTFDVAALRALRTPRAARERSPRRIRLATM